MISSGVDGSGWPRRRPVARVLRSPQALQDLDDIWFYIAQDNPDAADRWLDVLFDRAQSLADRPLMGRSRPEFAPDVRSLPVKAYMLYYRPITGGIELLRVLHGSRDVESGPLDAV